MRARKQKVNPGTLAGWAYHPELEASLRILMEEQQYSATDVAAMFGLSRERIRQFVGRFGIQQNGHNRGKRTRVWDDERNTFRPVRPDEYKAVMSVAPRQRKQRERIERRAATRAAIVAAVRACAKRLRRTPTAVEVWEAVSGTARETWRHETSLQSYAAGALAGRWTGVSSGRKGAFAAIWAAAGLKPRPKGRPRTRLRTRTCTGVKFLYT